MTDTKPGSGDAPTPAKRSFAAMRHKGFQAQFSTFVLSMMADNIEHVISYWMVQRKFHSPALAGFAIVSHWLPGLFAVGNDAASIFGGSYPGAGATLGPARTFGYICGKYLAESGNG